MKVHAVAKVRLDADGRVTGVEWGPVNTETNEWHTEPQSPTSPKSSLRSSAAKTCSRCSPPRTAWMPMRRFRVVEYDNGWKTVNLDGPPTHEHEIHDMLHVGS